MEFNHNPTQRSTEECMRLPQGKIRLRNLRGGPLKISSDETYLREHPSCYRKNVEIGENRDMSCLANLQHLECLEVLVLVARTGRQIYVPFWIAVPGHQWTPPRSLPRNPGIREAIDIVGDSPEGSSRRWCSWKSQPHQGVRLPIPTPQGCRPQLHQGPWSKEPRPP